MFKIIVNTDLWDVSGDIQRASTTDLRASTQWQYRTTPPTLDRSVEGLF